jgi:hypothetical protein
VSQPPTDLDKLARSIGSARTAASESERRLRSAEECAVLATHIENDPGMYVLSVCAGIVEIRMFGKTDGNRMPSCEGHPDLAARIRDLVIEHLTAEAKRLSERT